jgi:hypothetical protein
MASDKLGRLKHLYKTLIDTVSELHDANDMLYHKSSRKPTPFMGLDECVIAWY